MVVPKISVHVCTTGDVLLGWLVIAVAHRSQKGRSADCFSPLAAYVVPSNTGEQAVREEASRSEPD